MTNNTYRYLQNTYNTNRLSNYFLSTLLLTYYNFQSLIFSGMVDSLLEQFDVNEDGVLDFSEFMKSFVQARHDLGLL